MVKMYVLKTFKILSLNLNNFKIAYFKARQKF